MYTLSEEERKEIIDYCYLRIKDIDARVLNKNNIPVSFFLEKMYDRAEINYLAHEDFELDMDQIRTVFMLCKNVVDTEKMFVDGLCTLSAIDEYDNFFYKNILLIN